MGDYASKGLANGVGIPALVLGSLGFLGSGGLGSLFGGNGQNVIAEKDSKIAKLEAEKYSDSSNIELYKQIKSELKETDPWQETLKYHPEGINTSISLKDFKDKGYDVSMFHTETVDCDEEKTYGNLNVTVGKTEYSANLYCTYSFKSNENFEIIK